MKRFFLYIAAAVCLMSCNNKDSLWMTSVVDLDSRVSYLEQLCIQMNTNIESLQTIIKALQERDYVTNVAEIKEGDEVIGYTITFAINPSITIYKGNDGKDGKDGKDGIDGKNGQDGTTPQIGVAKDGDIYYWTLNGEWLLDAQGNKIRVTGENGKDGANGKDGIMPKLKIENSYWYISYDNGTTWSQLGKATGEKGDKGNDGDSMFKSVTYDANYVYLTLMDNTVITIPINQEGVKIIDGAIMVEFSVSPTKKVYFSQGNLQFNAALGTHLCADGTTKPGTWRFAEHQYDYVGFNGNGNVSYNNVKCDNSLISSTYSGWIDLFGFGTSGWNSGATSYQPWSTSTAASNYINNSLVEEYSYADWGVYNAISNGGNTPNTWRTLTEEEFRYLNFTSYQVEVNGTIGLLLLSKTFKMPEIAWNFVVYISKHTALESNCYNFSLEEWEAMEKNGAIFLPAARTSNGKHLAYTTSTLDISRNENIVLYQDGKLSSWSLISYHKYVRASVRLVKDVK